MNSTKHARVRSQQRGIPPLIVEWLMEFGATTRSHGAEKVFFDKSARQRLKKTFGEKVIDRLGDLLDTYLVVGDDQTLVTVAYRQKRIQRHG